MGKFMDEIKKGTDANEALKKVTGTSVSYTHLDVYKRQLSDVPPERDRQEQSSMPYAFSM